MPLEVLAWKPLLLDLYFTNHSKPSCFAKSLLSLWHIQLAKLSILSGCASRQTWTSQSNPATPIGMPEAEKPSIAYHLNLLHVGLLLAIEKPAQLVLGCYIDWWSIQIWRCCRWKFSADLILYSKKTFIDWMDALLLTHTTVLTYSECIFIFRIQMFLAYEDGFYGMRLFLYHLSIL